MVDDEVLNKAGMHIDDMNRLRLLNPEISDMLTDLRSEGRSFAAQMTSFRTTTEGLIKAFEEILIRERQVELERLRVELASLQVVEQQQKDILQKIIHG
ncbi:unnamed protein product [Nippostrongylus brasiliensis]|uniref:PAS domain S-box protein n=1 Tax=Nippostrongylus brasiliensis TaxID=27835 RepID=A0A0N4XV18_NIPBR|nr:unnamed protein product [Nippostrongylus brasiliensis]